MAEDFRKAAKGVLPVADDEQQQQGKAGKATGLGVLFGCFGRKIDGPALPGGLIIYQGHLFPLKGHLWQPEFLNAARTA